MTYEYICPCCGNINKRQRKIAEIDRLVSCDLCGKVAKMKLKLQIVQTTYNKKGKVEK